MKPRHTENNEEKRSTEQARQHERAQKQVWKLTGQERLVCLKALLEWSTPESIMAAVEEAKEEHPLDYRPIKLTAAEYYFSLECGFSDAWENVTAHEYLGDCHFDVWHVEVDGLRKTVAMLTYDGGEQVTYSFDGTAKTVKEAALWFGNEHRWDSVPGTFLRAYTPII